MNHKLDDRLQETLYHALGADTDAGLAQFDVVFRDAEAAHRLDDLNALLDLLAEPTLPEERLPSWRQYYRARVSLLLWRTDEAGQLLEDIPIVHQNDRARLEPRVALLQGRIQLRRESWSASRSAVSGVLKQVRATEERSLLVEAYETLAQAHILEAHSAGHWMVPQEGRLARLWRSFLTLALFPLYVPLLIGFWVSGMGPFSRPALRFGADYINWPIFQHYLNAYRALVKAREAAKQLDESHRFRLDMMWAGLLRDLTLHRQAVDAYNALLDRCEEAEDEHRKALVLHGLAKTRLEMGGLGSTEQLRSDLEVARAAYVRAEDELGLAYLDLLLGDIALIDGDESAAVRRWQAAIEAFEAKHDAGGLAEALGRCYVALDRGLAADSEEEVKATVRSAERLVFRVRLPNATYRIVQWLGWTVPLMGVLVLAALLTRYTAQHSRDEYEVFLANLFSLPGLGILGMVLVAGMVVYTLLGLVGLLASLRTQPARLDLFELDGEGLSRYDYAGNQVQRMPWPLVDLHLRVERAVLIRPTRVLSFDFLRSADGETLRLPATTSWFPHLQWALEERLERPAPQLGMQWHGGAIVYYTGLFFAGTFLLTESVFEGWLSVTQHAQAVAAFELVSFALIVFVTGRWCAHYTRVNSITLPTSQFVAGTALVAVLLVALGALGRRYVYLVAPFVITWGTVLLAIMAGCLWKVAGSQRRQFLIRAVQGVSIVVGLLLVVRALLSTVGHTQAYTYAGALQRLEPGQPDYLARRQDLMGHLQPIADRILRVDPRHVQAHYYVGICAYSRGEYGESVEAFSEAIRLGTWVAVYHCRALAYHAMGDEERAQQDIEAYRKNCKKCDQLFCLSYFPEAEGVFDLGARPADSAVKETQSP